MASIGILYGTCISISDSHWLTADRLISSIGVDIDNDICNDCDVNDDNISSGSLCAVVHFELISTSGLGEGFGICTDTLRYEITLAGIICMAGVMPIYSIYCISTFDCGDSGS